MLLFCCRIFAAKLLCTSGPNKACAVRPQNILYLCRLPIMIARAKGRHLFFAFCAFLLCSVCLNVNKICSTKILNLKVHETARPLRYLLPYHYHPPFASLKSFSICFAHVIRAKVNKTPFIALFCALLQLRPANVRLKREKGKRRARYFAPFIA